MSLRWAVDVVVGRAVQSHGIATRMASGSEEGQVFHVVNVGDMECTQIRKIRRWVEL